MNSARTVIKADGYTLVVFSPLTGDTWDVPIIAFVIEEFFDTDGPGAGTPDNYTVTPITVNGIEDAVRNTGWWAVRTPDGPCTTRDWGDYATKAELVAFFRSQARAADL